MSHEDFAPISAKLPRSLTKPWRDIRSRAERQLYIVGDDMEIHHNPNWKAPLYTQEAPGEENAKTLYSESSTGQNPFHRGQEPKKLGSAGALGVVESLPSFSSPSAKL